MYRLVTVGVLIAAVLVAAFVLPDISMVARDVELRLQITYGNMGFSAYATMLAMFLVWRVGDRAGGRELGLVLALMALSLALSIVPQRDPTTLHRLAFGTTWWFLNAMVVRFWARFPQDLDMTAVSELGRKRSTGMWYDGPNRISARVVHWTLGHALGKALLALGIAAFAFVLVGPYAAPYNFFAPQQQLGMDYMIVAGPVSLAAILVIAMVAWTSFRLSDERGRRQVLWAMMGHLIAAFFAVMAVALAVAVAVTGSEVLTLIEGGLLILFHPVNWAATLTGYALAIFLSGAFDLRPLISRSTVYGASILLLTFLFAGVEEVMEAQVMSRIALPEGAGTWVGAASIAVCLGPVRGWMERGLQRWVPDLHDGGAGEVADRG